MKPITFVVLTETFIKNTDIYTVMVPDGEDSEYAKNILKKTYSIVEGSDADHLSPEDNCDEVSSYCKIVHTSDKVAERCPYHQKNNNYGDSDYWEWFGCFNGDVMDNHTLPREIFDLLEDNTFESKEEAMAAYEKEKLQYVMEQSKD